MTKDRYRNKVTTFLNDKVYDTLEKERGNVPFSTYVRELLEEYVKMLEIANNESEGI